MRARIIEAATLAIIITCAIGYAVASVQAFDAIGDERCATGEWSGEAKCPRSRATGEYGASGKWRWEQQQ